MVDVPAKIAARSRVFDTGRGRSVADTQLADAHLQRGTGDAATAGRPARWAVGAAGAGREPTARLLTELIPGRAGKDLTAAAVKRVLATVRPRSVVGMPARRMAVEEVTDLAATDALLKALTRSITTLP